MQHDYNIANQSFPSFRTDLNNALSAIQTCNSGTSRPTGAVAGQIWLDTTSATTPTLKYYDGADDISLATLDHSANTVNWLDSTVSITGLSTTATGTVLTLSDSASTTTVNLIIDNEKEIRFREATANGTNYVALKAPASVSADLTFTLPATDGTAGQALTTNGSGVLSFSTIQSPSGFRNIVINGDMQIAQRSTSVASITTSGYYTLDRWNPIITTMGTWTMSQSTDVPSGYGFAKSLKMDCTTADASPASGDRIYIRQNFEGQNLQYLKKGTASAVSLTASFWVKSTKTGTFICELHDTDNTRNISKSYTVNTTNTWEFKTITFAGDTTGALNNDNDLSLTINWYLGAGTDWTSGTLATSWESITNANRAVGQVNCADSTSNDFLITGVQLEAGTSATDFEFLPYDVSLQRCLRYYEKIKAESTSQLFGAGFNFSTTQGIALINCSKKRTDVSVTFSSTVGDFGLYSATGTIITATAIVASRGTSISFATTVTVASGLTAGDGTTFISNLTTNPYIEISAEL
jgi:hypothetical protein